MRLRQTVCITGANSGIGLATARSLAAQGDSIIMICRNKIEGDKIAEELKNQYPECKAENFVADLSDFDSVHNAALAVLSKYPSIDRLINNAGFYPREIEYVNNIEKTLLASHLGHMLLTMLLLPALQKSHEARIINVSSGLHSKGKVSRFFVQTLKHNPLLAYADAKLANVLFTMALSKRLPENITTYSLHPGVVKTNFGTNVTGLMKMMINIFNPFFLSPAKGALTTLYLTNQNINDLKFNSGCNFAKCKPGKFKNEDATDKNASWLWDRSLEILKKQL